MKLSRRSRLWIPLVVAGPLYGAASYSPVPSKQTSEYDLGLAAWRKSGKIDNAACANCHGPDGFELAIYDFTDANILRRARPHLGDVDAQRVLGLIHAVRHKYGIQKRLDPMLDRPFQPTGRVLPGATAPERDVAFGHELEDRLPLLMKGKITTLDEAKAAADQIMALDPWSLQIGVPFNRFSEDVFHGREHASLAHWLPDIARVLPAPNTKSWYALQDAYLADPSDTNLWKLYDGFGTLTNLAKPTGIASIAEAKYRSLLLMQHALRREALGDKKDRGAVAFIDNPNPLVPNPMWDIGEAARRFQDLSPEGLGLNPAEMKKKSGGPKFRAQMVDMQASWFWLGWLFDQGLERTSRNMMSARGDWLALSLWVAGPYQIHNIYWLTRKQLVVNRIPKAWGGQPNRRKPEWDYLAIRIGGRYISEMPKDPEHRRMYINFAANSFRMTLLLMLDEWRRTKEVWYKSASEQHVRALTKFIGDFQPDSAAEAEKMRQELDEALAACTERT